MNIKNITGRQWINFSFWVIFTLAFTLWTSCWWLLLLLPVVFDIYITKFVRWGGWRKSSNPQIQKTLNLIDDLIFALLAVYIINIFFFQNYQIPSSSLEKTLLVGDYLFVSKLSYGPRIPNTPISFPLVQNTFPVVNTKSYIEWPKWGYKRVKGFGEVKRDDIVVFNFPAGDTIAFIQQNPDYYTLVKQYGSREAIRLNPGKFGEIMYRPVDKRENFVKRCVGMPGDSLQIVNNQIYVDGKIQTDEKNVQYNYYVETNGVLFDETIYRKLGISVADRIYLFDANAADPQKASEIAYYNSTLPFLDFTPDAQGRYNPIYVFPLNKIALEKVKKLPYVTKVIVEPDVINGQSSLVFPVDYDLGWTRDNYGPVWIPQKGATITLNAKNLALYSRCIRNYENNELEIKPDGLILINGQSATTYTFKYDYYWMMGDNRHKSADSRSWGFVPEDHVVGKPILVWLSLDKDRGWLDGKIRFDRMFRFVTSFN
jgi:signal peptidase I